MRRDAVGLNIVQPGTTPNPLLARVREQLRAADALVTVERDQSEPDAVRTLRRHAEGLLRESRYEEAQEAFLDCIDAGLRYDFFPWQAAVNLVNCHRFLGRLDEAEETAFQLGQMYTEQPEHPLHYLIATQLGAIAADRFAESGEADHAATALEWARAAYDWQHVYRQNADGLRAYNLVVALLRLGQRAEALESYRRHEHDDDFQAWCRQGDRAADIAALVAEG